MRAIPEFSIKLREAPAECGRVDSSESHPMKKKKFYEDVSLMRNAGKYLDWFPLPVPVNMRRAEGKAVVDEGGVYHDP